MLTILGSRTTPQNIQTLLPIYTHSVFDITAIIKQYKQNVTHLYLSSEVKCAFPAVYEVSPLLHIYQ